MSFGTVGTDVMERINWVRLRKEKKEKALKSMKEAGLGAILTMYEENIRYISSTHGPEWTKTIPGFVTHILGPRVLLDRLMRVKPRSSLQVSRAT